ncbi:MAG: PAS domain S-box protein [Candidatus Thorarchaeota archaeon]|nr:PAS domain S-box protein [Candidatus Thorarchaeota archaeon]
MTNDSIPNNIVHNGEDIYSQLFDSANDSIIIHTSFGEILYVNLTMCERLGYSREELMRLRIRDIDKTDNSKDSATLIEDLQERKRIMFESIHWTKEGKQIPVEVNSTFLHFQAIPAILSIARDISGRIRARERIQRSEKTLNEAQRIAHIGNWDWRIKENIHLWSDELYHIFGIDPQPVDPDTFYDFIHPDDVQSVKDAVEKSISEHAPFDIVFRIRLSDGNEKYVHEIGESEHDENGEITRFFGTTMDITESYLANLKLQRSNRDLELYANLLQHDLRSDLHLILTQIESHRLSRHDTTESSNFLDVVQTAAQRMAKLLDLFQAPPEFYEADIVTMLNGVKDEALLTNPRLKINISNTTGQESLNASAGRLLPLVWTNLLRNVIDYAGPQAEVSIVLKKIENSVIIEVSDNGPGIPTSIKDNLFGKGVSTSGKGFGLYLCRKVVEAYDGSIELIHDKTKKGATFRVKLQSL